MITAKRIGVKNNRINLYQLISIISAVEEQYVKIDRQLNRTKYNNIYKMNFDSLEINILFNELSFRLKFSLRNTIYLISICTVYK